MQASVDTHPLLAVNGLDVSYGGAQAVRSCSFSVEPGQIIGIIGESGSGKSTILKSIMGLLGPSGSIDAGTIELLGEKHELIKETATDEVCSGIRIDIHHPHLWSPEDPFLYDFVIEGEGGDRIESYFALRTLSICS